MRMIDADELEKEWTIASPEPYNTDAVEVLDSIRNMPTIDAVLVVRCKACYQSVVIGDVLYCTYWGKNTDENGYCHEGG